MLIGVTYLVCDPKTIICRKLKRQVVNDFKGELEGTTSWTRSWILWKRRMAVQIRYDNLLFSKLKVSPKFTLRRVVL